MNKPDDPNPVVPVLATFIANNPHCEVKSENDEILVNRPWGTDNSRLRFSSTSAQLCEDLNQTIINPRFDALYHQDQQRIEFIFGYLYPQDEVTGPYVDRKFKVVFQGLEFSCSFSEPTERLYRIASTFERLPTETNDRTAYQLVQFKDVQNLDKLPPGAREFFAKRVPRSFFIAGPIEKVSVPALARHINFLARYYDRLSAGIVIRESDAASRLAPANKPLRHIESVFPENLAVGEIDDVILRLIEVANESPSRFAFLYFYQVLEYTGYYYLDEKVKNSLRTFLKDPAVINCGDEHIAELIAIFSDLTHNDDAKMRKVIEENINPRVLWKEIEHNKAFFSMEQSFDGGFVSSPLIAADTSAESWRAMWMPKTYDQLTKIRNALVHARERRENRVILPTAANNRKVAQYVSLIRRLAERLALSAP